MKIDCSTIYYPIDAACGMAAGRKCWKRRRRAPASSWLGKVLRRSDRLAHEARVQGRAAEGCEDDRRAEDTGGVLVRWPWQQAQAGPIEPRRVSVNSNGNGKALELQAQALLLSVH